MSTAKKSVARATVKAVLVVGLLIGFGLLNGATVVVEVGHRGVLFDKLRKGTQQAILGEGLHVVNPLTTTVYQLNVQTQTYTMSNAQQEGNVAGQDGIQAKTRDGQNVTVDVSLRYHCDPAQVSRLFQTVGLDYEQKVVLPSVRSAVRDIFTLHNAESVYSERRGEIAEAITAKVTAELAQRGLMVDDCLLRDIAFTDEYFAAIENKQIEQQTALRKQFELEIAEREAEVRKIRAQGEATANNIRGQALKQNAKIVQYEYVRKIAPNVQALLVNSTDLKRGAGAP
ncbi:MAG: prohibitin family protein [Fimbriimonadaceae bacterium]|nr:prohibitin family protein [Fimbriimonadaceae bacterium]